MEKHHASCSAFVLLCCTTINVFVGATSIVPFFSDPSCQDRSFTGQTDQQAFSGTCQPVSQEANSVDPGSLDSCCAVTVYTGPYCSNNPTLAPNGTCTTLNIGSWSVDCPCVPSASPQSASSAAPSTSSSSTSVSSSSAPSTSKPSAATSSSTSVASAMSSTTTSSSTKDPPPSTSTANPTDPPLLSQSTSQSTSPSPSTAATSKNGGGSSGGDGLSVSAQIAIGVVIPSLSLIVAVIFGVRMWRRR